jgi:hypothetical protein
VQKTVRMCRCQGLQAKFCRDCAMPTANPGFSLTAVRPDLKLSGLLTRLPSHIFFRKPSPMAVSHQNFAWLFVLRLVVCGVCSLSLGALAGAQDPVIDRLDGSGLHPGQKAEVVVSGKQLQGTMALWTPVGTLRLKSGADVSKDQPVALEGDISADAIPGIYPVRLVTDHGCSEASWVVVDDLPTVSVTAEADNRSSGQAVSVPCSIAGQLNAVAPRFFRCTLTEGQQITAEVFARRLSSELDPVLRLLGPDGRELVYSDDVPGTEGDALLQWQAAVAGEYRLELRDVRYTGGARHFFHLRLGRIPAAVTALPRLVTAGAAVSLLDAQGAVLSQATAGESAAGAGALVPVRSRGAEAEASSIVSAVVVSGVISSEAEPNDQREQSTAVAAEAVGIAGSFQQPGDSDWYRISAAAAGNLTALARTRDAASPADLQLELYNAEGGRLAESDDAGPKDAEISFQLPAAGDYFLKVTELAGRGGPVWSYAVQLHLGKPSVLVTLPADRLSVPRGGSASLVLGLRRLQYDGALKVEAVGLPAALQMEPIVAGGRQSAVPLVLTATDPAATAGDADWGPVSVRVSALDGSVPATVVQLVPPPPRKADADLFRSMRARADLFVAVRPAGEFSLKAEPSAVTVEQGATATVTVKAVRGKDWTVPIEIALATPADQLSPGLAVAGGNMTADELAITITAAADAAAGPCTVFLQGKSKKDNNERIFPLPPVRVEVTAKAK